MEDGATMGRSTELRLIDVRRAFRLLGDCRDLGGDAEGWHRRMREGLRDLLGAKVVVEIELTPAWPSAPVAATCLGYAGWETASQERGWRDQFERRMFLEEELPARFAALSGSRVVTRSREQLLDDREWDRSPDRRNRVACGMDSQILTVQEIGPARASRALSVHRGVGEGGFGARERKLLHLFRVEQLPLLGKSLACPAADPYADLPARLRKTLEALLQGDGEKQAALRLGLSRHTVHEYVTELYRRFGVRSRGELLARCLRGR